MSRSYRKPWIREVSKKGAKRQANKIVRKMEDVPDGMKFKRAYCSWNISDYRFYDNRPKAKRK